MRWIAALFLLVLPASATAQGWIEPIPRPVPQPVVQRVERLRTSVTVRVTDRVARVEVEEWFRNAGGGVAEGDYIYPLAGEAVFSDFSLFQGEEELRGETMEAGRARAIYEEIVRRRRDPALIEMAGHGLLRARVFPFGPGETRNVRLRFTQVLDRAGDALRFRYVAGSRRPQGQPAAGSAGSDAAPLSFTLVADNAARFAEPFSPTDRLQVTRNGDRLSVRPAVSLSGSFDIFLPLAGSSVGMTLATHRVNSEDGYFMLTLSPGAVKAAPEPRDLAVVVDTSGSMSGEKIEQARDALRQLLGTLNAKDRFRLVSFGNEVRSFRPEWADATNANVDAARIFVDDLSAAGGTNIAGALDEAMRTPPGTGRLHVVVFITDGQPTVGETDPDRIAARVEGGRGQARIFTFGVGHDLNTYLLDRLAVAGRGTVDYVAPGKSVEEAVGSLANRIRLPVLVDLAFAGAPVRIKDVQPARLPDLYAGQDLVIFGRYESTGSTATGDLAIAGTRAGQKERFAARVDFPAHASGDYIPGLWAARKVGELTRTIKLEGRTPERIAEIRDLALRYGLLTEYTSYLVQEPGVSLSRNGTIGGARGGRAAAGGGGGGGGASPPPAAAPVSGAAAVDAARGAARLQSARTEADVAAAQFSLAGSLGESETGTRVVAGRRFRSESSAWVDTAHTPQARVVEIEPFSAAYFAVLAKLPELKPYWSAFEAVVVAGRQVSIRVAAGGRSTLMPGEIDALVASFRTQ
jgi:Ca-activated chloride channel family protein